MRSEREVVAIIVATFVLISGYVVFCNWFDWDLFLSFSEVDRRSWLLDGEPPRWSYQLCSGISRIGDPQSFALSPLFLVVLLFGTFWGSKLAAIFSIAFGLYASAALFELLAGGPGGLRISRVSLYTLALLFVASNFFLWHLLVGHLNFINFYFALGIIFYTFKGFLVGLKPSDLVLGVLITWQHYSGFPFHSTAYLLVPFFLAFSLFVAWVVIPARASGLPGERGYWERATAAASFHVLGILLAFYKLIPVWRYQQSFPRTLPDESELVSVIQFLSYHAIPTWGGRWLVPLDQTGNWALHEYSAFSLLLPVVLVSVCRLVWRRLRRTTRHLGDFRERHAVAPFVVIYLVVSSAFALGDFSVFAPFTLVNHYLFDDALRAVGRFNVGVTLSLALACILLLRRLGPAGFSPGFRLLLVGMLVLNICGFSWMLSWPRAAFFWAVPEVGRSEMRVLRKIDLFPPGSRLHKGNELDPANSSQMYPVLRAGQGVINCYNPLQRPRPSHRPSALALPLIDASFGSPGKRCIKESYYTQNRLRIAPSCPSEVCLNISWLNPDEGESGIHYDEGRGQFCRRAAH